jgi:hypothetical protein
MRKLRPDSKWNKLTAEQQETLERWLFEENIAYHEALERVKREFGIAVSMRGLSEYYKRLARVRMRRELIKVKAAFKGFDEWDSAWELLGDVTTAMTVRRKKRWKAEVLAARLDAMGKMEGQKGPISG